MEPPKPIIDRAAQGLGVLGVEGNVAADVRWPEALNFCLAVRTGATPIPQPSLKSWLG